MPTNSTRRPEDHNTPIYSKDDIVQLEEEYETVNNIPCAIIGCHQPHKKGRYALLKDGDISRVGHICGKKLLGDETFTAMQRDFDRRRQRALREEYISSLSFDPDRALVGLHDWNHRIQTSEKMLQEMAIIDAMVGTKWLNDLRTAVEKHDGLFEYWGHDGRWKATRLRSGKFLSKGWQNYFGDARSSIQFVLRILSKEGLTDGDLEQVIIRSSEAQRKLRIVGDALDSFDAFCKSESMINLMKRLYPKLNLPSSIGPVDREPIQVLESS